MGKTRRPYAPEFRRRMVELVRTGCRRSLWLRRRFREPVRGYMVENRSSMTVRRSLIAAVLLLMCGVACAPDTETDESRPDLAFEAVRQQALAVEQNDRGYRESDLGDGHILIYVPDLCTGRPF